MGERIDLSERLFNLTCALLSTRVGLSKGEIFATVQGYKESFDPNGDQTALNRMFERDKVLLTESGIAWRAFIPKEAMEDNQEYRYLIANEDFVWPRNFRPNAKQVALMNLAAKAWAKASMAQTAQVAIQRIRAMGEDASSDELIGIAPRIRTHDRAFESLSEAIAEKFVVGFEYRKPTQQSGERRLVEPWTIRNVSGQWLLLGFDRVRGEARNYLLRRIVSNVLVSEEKFEKPDPRELENALAELDFLISKQQAVIEVAQSSSAWFHFNLDEDQSEMRINFMDVHLLADELMEFADQIKVISPPELAEVVSKRLKLMMENHE